LVPLEIFGGPTGSRLDQCCVETSALTLMLETTASTASCPICRAESDRVHSRYHRALADLPCFGKSVRLVMTVRRFFCAEAECPRRIFCERLLGFAGPYSRATDRLREAYEAIGSALGGAPGSRLTVRLAIATSPDTLLRRVKQLKGQCPAPPDSSVSTTGRGARGDATARSLWTWSEAMSSSFSPIAMRRPSRSGWTNIPELSSSVAIGRQRTLKRPPNRRPKPCRSLIVGTC
jgi:hypothetical protein